MATQTIEFEAPSGLTLTARLYTKGSDTIAYTASSVVESTNRKGIYSAIFSSVSDNLYQLVATSGSTGVVSWWGHVKNNNSTYQFGQNIYAGSVWDVDHRQHMIANTFGKLIDIIHKANLVIEGVVTGAITPTTTQFSSDVNYPTGAFKHSVLLWVNGSTLSEQNSPILTYTNTNGVILVEEPFTQAPQIGDTFVIIPSNHVHSITAIADGVRTELTPELTYIDVPISSRLAANAVPPQSGIAEGADSCGMNIVTFYGEVRTITLALFDINGDPYDFSGLTLRLCIQKNNKVNLEVFEQGDLTIVGNVITFETSVANDVIGQHYWSLRSLPDDLVLAQGTYNVRKAALT